MSDLNERFNGLDDMNWLAEYEPDVDEPKAEPVYVDVDDSGESDLREAQKMMVNSLRPKNRLQTRLLNIFNSQRFGTVAERKRWMKIQNKANATPDGRVWLAWVITGIEWGEYKKANQKGVKRFPYMAVMSFLENENAFKEFDDRYRDLILKKATPDEVKDVHAARLEELYNSQD
jgi:hypothetical protein